MKSTTPRMFTPERMSAYAWLTSSSAYRLVISSSSLSGLPRKGSADWHRIAGRAHAVEGALDALLEHGDGDGVEAGDRRALTLVADADHDHRAGLADGTEGLPDVLVLDDADADDRRVKRDFPAQKINQKWYGDGTEIKTGQGKLYLASVLDMASRRYSASRSASTTTPL
jgi:transposase InsO family protein